MSNTNDGNTTLQHLKTKIEHFATERDWLQFHTPKNLSMALAAEAAELMEHYLWAESSASAAVLNDPAKRQKIEEELADVVIYSIQFANRANIDLSTAIQNKILQNAQKYPVEKARGSSKKYTEL